jgi:hypothetical protein
MQAVADALSLLANILMARNTAQMQAILDNTENICGRYLCRLIH